MKTLDRTPSITRESSSRKRRKSGRTKPFKIEGRYIGPKGTDFVTAVLEKGREWHVVGAYETERGQRDALRSLQTNGGWWSKQHEYRLAEAS